jgi:hypothetical protein
MELALDQLLRDVSATGDETIEVMRVYQKG